MRIALVVLMLILLVGVAGASEWAVSIGGSYVDEAYAIQQTSDGENIVAGTTLSFGSGNSDAWVTKLDSSGNIPSNAITFSSLGLSGTFSNDAYSFEQSFTINVSSPADMELEIYYTRMAWIVLEIYVNGVYAGVYDLVSGNNKSAHILLDSKWLVPGTNTIVLKFIDHGRYYGDWYFNTYKFSQRPLGISPYSYVSGSALVCSELPVADFTYTISGLTVTFDASSSYDPDGPIVSYSWDFGDGSTASGVTVTHTYSSAGTYTVTLTVTDDDGQTASTSKQITVSSSGTTISLIPSKTTVAPGDQFNLDIFVSGESASSVLVNFTFNPDQVSVVDTTTYGKFSLMDLITLGSNCVKYLGVSSTPVDISTSTKIATITFQVAEDVTEGDNINFGIVKANVDGTDVSVEVTPVTVASEPWQKYDSNGDGKISDMELINAIMDWLNGDISDMDLLDVIVKWLSS